MKTLCHVLLASFAFFLIQPKLKAVCPFCAATGLSYRQRFEFADVVALASLQSTQKSDNISTGLFVVVDTIKPGPIKIGDQLTIAYYGPENLAERFLIQGVEPPEIIWDLPVSVSEPVVSYLKEVNHLQDDSLDRLKFFAQHLEHKELIITQDAYDEFAIAPYDEILKIKDAFDRNKLRQWIEDPTIPTPRKQLYYMLLSACGVADDADWLEQRLRSEDPLMRQGLDALTASYLSLSGAKGLSVIDELFIQNRQREFAETFAVLAAMRFHATEGKIIEPLEISNRLATMLDREEIVDLVVPDLARMEDWRHIDRLMNLFWKSYETKITAIRTPTINYLRACPLPEAQKALKDIEDKDPGAIKRAKGLIPFLPQKSPAKG